MQEPSPPTALAALEPAPYNPRAISPRAASGLRRSLVEFGDVSGLTYNFRTGNLIAGHARREALAHLAPEDIVWEGWHDTDLGPERWGSIKVAGGSTFKVRGVDWPAIKEKAANIAANSPAIAGDFTEGLRDLLAEVEAEIGDTFGELNFDELVGTVAREKIAPDEFPTVDPDEVEEGLEHTCPKCGFQFS